MRFFCNTRATLLEQSCIWILHIVAVIALVTSASSAQPLDERYPSLFDRYNNKPMYQPDTLMRLLERTAVRERRGHHLMSDAGYGSRVAAASKLASALTARDDLFGSFGPGRKKRTTLSDSDLFQRQQSRETDVESQLL